MVVSRITFFFAILTIVLSPFIVPKIIWLANSKKATGTMRFVGKEYTGQLIHLYSVISFIEANDTIWFKSKDNTIYEVGEKVPVRFQTNNPSDAKVNIFFGIWSDTVVYGTAPLLIVLLIFFHPHGIPRRVKLHLGYKRPFIRVC